MSRNFDGVNDQIVTALGSVPSTGPFTYATIFKRGTTDNGFLWGTHDSGNLSVNIMRILGFATDVYELHINNSAVQRTSTFTILPSDNWVILVVSKAAGTVLPRCHRYKFDTATWTHENMNATMADASGTADRVIFGERNAASDDLNGKIALAGAWTSVLSDSDVELLDNGLSSWTSLNPVALWRFDTDNVVSGLQDTIGGADETSHTGTTFSTDEPTGFSYAASAPTGGGGGAGTSKGHRSVMTLLL